MAGIRMGFLMRVINLLKWTALCGAFGVVGCASRTVIVRERVVHHDPVVEKTETFEETPVVEVAVEKPVIEVVVEPVIEVIIDRPTEVVVTTFHNDLAPHGVWVDIDGYGRCWKPNGTRRGWRPYTIGHWEWTASGWSWESDEAFGYATYHYGRWFVDARHGWVWLPGTTYAPAWVAWRSGGGYVGWAPLGPTVSEAEVHVTEYHTRNIPAVQFTFVEEKKITDRKIHDRAVNVEKNVTIINKTTNITNINVENKVVVNKSLSVEQVEKVTGKKVKVAPVKEVTDAAEAKRLRAKGEVVVYKPAALAAEREKAIAAHHEKEIAAKYKADEKREQ